MEKIDYKFNEDEILKEFQKYIDGTYNQHYSSCGKIQVTEFIASHCPSPDFFRGNAMKYLARYGFKEGYNRKDLLKAMHYLLMLIDWNDKRWEDKTKQMQVSNNTAWIDEATSFGEDYNIISNTVFAPSQNVYVTMSGGKIGQEQNGTIVEVGYGKLDEHGCLIPGTFRYSSEENINAVPKKVVYSFLKKNSD